MLVFLLRHQLCTIGCMSDDFAKHFPLRQARTHEVCGAGAQAFAFALAGQMRASVLWISEDWQTAQINPVGFGVYLAPQNMLIAKVKDQVDGLASAEEALRSGAVSLVVIELSKPLSLLAGRRLQLAAEAGKSTGLCIIPEGAGSNAAESRWRCEPVFDAGDSTLMRWEIIKNKTGTLANWNLRWDAKTSRIIVVSKAAQRPGSARASG